MKHLTLLTILVLSMQAAAESSFFGGAPAIARPTPSPTAPAAPARPAAFKQCSERNGLTRSSETARRMFEEILKIQNPFEQVILGTDGSSFRLVGNRSELQVGAVVPSVGSDPLYMPAYICQSGENVEIRLVYDAGFFGGIHRNNILIKPVSANRLHLTHIRGDNPFPSGIFTVNNSRTTR